MVIGPAKKRSEILVDKNLGCTTNHILFSSCLGTRIQESSVCPLDSQKRMFLDHFWWSVDIHQKSTKSANFTDHSSENPPLNQVLRESLGISGYVDESWHLQAPHPGIKLRWSLVGALRATWGYEFGASNLEWFSWMFDGMFQKFQGCEFSPEMVCTPKNGSSYEHVWENGDWLSDLGYPIFRQTHMEPKPETIVGSKIIFGYSWNLWCFSGSGFNSPNTTMFSHLQRRKCCPKRRGDLLVEPIMTAASVNDGAAAAKTWSNWSWSAWNPFRWGACGWGPIKNSKKNMAIFAMWRFP